MNSTSRIAHAFARRREHGQAALIPYVTAGFPELDDTDRVLDACPGLKVVGNCAVGFDNIELDAARRRGVWDETGL